MNGMWRACAGALVCVLGWAVEAAPGDWDRSFGVDGRVPLSVDVTGTARVWKQQADGKIVTVGDGMDASGRYTGDFVIARFNPDGSPDASLDGDGVLRVNLEGWGPSGGLDIEVLPDGRLLFAGQAGRNADHVRLLRFNVDGSPDTSFGTGGQISLTDPRWVQNPHVALTPSGAALLVARLGDWMTNPSIVIARVTADGVLDTSFGTNGRTVVDAPSGDLEAYLVRSDANGAAVMGGKLGTLDNGAPFVARVTSTGQLDSSFGTDGFVVMPFLQGDGWMNRLAIAADGKILAAGERSDTHFVARLNTNGTFDAGFGSGGRVVVAGAIKSMLLEPDGKLLLGGSINELLPGIAWLGRYNTDGSPDVTFGLRGRSRVDFGLGAASRAGMFTHIQRDGDGGYRAVVLLTEPAVNTATSRFALTRFVANGSNAGAIGLRSSREDWNQPILSVTERVASYPIMIYRSGGTDGTVTAQYRVVGQSATAGQDFVADSGTVTFNDGETVKSIELRTLDDGLPEGVETFYVELFAPGGGASLSRSRMNVQMASDGDLGSRISLVAYRVRAIEGAGSIRFLVERTGDLRAPLTVDYATVAGTASAGTDFTAASGTVSWPANEGGVRAIDLMIVDDATVEGDEQFSLELSSSDPVAVFGTDDRTAVIGITDDDDAARSPTVTLKSTLVVVSEGASVVTFEARRLGDPSQALSANWSTSVVTGNSSAIARAGVDYTAGSGTLTWAAGDSSPKTFTVPIIDDAASETAEFIVVSVYAPYPVVTLDGQASAFIADNDPVPTQPVVSISPDASFDEGVGNANFTVTLTGVPGSTVRVRWDLRSETASLGDVMWTSGTLTWAVGDSATKQISIPILDDTRDEIDETFVVFLSDPEGGAQFGRVSSRVTIVDNDPTPAGQSPPSAPGVQLAASAISVREGDRVARLTVSRTGGTEAVNVICTVLSGTASEPADFIGGSSVLYWPEGNTDSQQVDIQLNGDAQVEPDETFTVRFTVSLGPVALPQSTATITVVDDDGPNSAPSQIDFANTALSVNESATSVTLQVGRSGNTAFASSVDYITVAGSAGTADYAATSGTLTWDANDTSTKLITIPLTPDTQDEADESFIVQLRNVSSGTEIGTASASVSIVDDDAAPGAPNPSGGGGGGGGGEESLIALLLWAALVRMRWAALKGRR